MSFAAGPTSVSVTRSDTPAFAPAYVRSMKLPCVTQSGIENRNQPSAKIPNACLVTGTVIPRLGNPAVRVLDAAGSAEWRRSRKQLNL